LVLVHISLLHEYGSSHPIGSENLNYIPFYPYFWLKDFFAVLCMLFVLNYLVCFEPNLLGHPSNYIKANPMVTPEHIVPE
jgi:ubiquinol-cytochrome c reductase cytochrome b subunit